MVCAKCAARKTPTSLATPNVKRKSEIYYGSPASGAGIGNASSPSSAQKTKSISATLGNAGISKSKLLSKAAKNPYASYSSKCKTCGGKTEQGKVLCHGCAYKSNSCAMCGKSQSGGAKKGGAVVTGQKFSAK